LDVAVVNITAYDEPSVRAECEAAGAAGYRAKAINGAVLRQVIDNATE